ncbi:MAG: porin [Pseudomonadota bacterium]
MNKKLLALAIGAAAAMPLVAQADGPTLYGKINVSLESVSDGGGNRLDSDLDDLAPVAPATTAPTDMSDEGWVVRNNASRLGVKGDAETGVDGVKGIYQIEVGVTADGEGGPFSQRDTFAGLKGGFGNVRIGVMDTPFKKAQGKVDQFNDTAADMGTHIAGENRQTNLVYYTSPKIAEALTVHVAVAPGENQDDPDPAAPAAATLDGIADSTSVALMWEGKSLYLAAAMDMMVKNGSSKGAELSKGNWLDATRLVAGYKGDAFAVGFLYQIAEEAFDVGGNTDEDTSMLLSGAYTMDKLTLKAQYGTTEGDDGAAGTDTEVTQMSLGADYSLGKATTLFAFFSNIDADDGVATTEDEYEVISFGMEQKF